MNKDITPLNDKGQRHGLWKVYSYKGSLQFQRFYQNSKEVGYEEYYSYLSEICKKKYYI